MRDCHMKMYQFCLQLNFRIPCAYLVWLFGLFNNLNKYEWWMCVWQHSFDFLCVNALWISMDFSSDTTMEARLCFAPNKSMFWYFDMSMLADFVYGVRAIWINMPKKHKNMFARYGFGYDFRRFQVIFDLQAWVCMLSRWNLCSFFCWFCPFNINQKHSGLRLVHISQLQTDATRWGCFSPTLRPHHFGSLNRKVQLTETYTLSVFLIHFPIHFFFSLTFTVSCTSLVSLVIMLVVFTFVLVFMAYYSIQMNVFCASTSQSPSL